MSPSTKDFISDRDESTASRLVPLMPLDQAEPCPSTPPARSRYPDCVGAREMPQQGPAYRHRRPRRHAGRGRASDSCIRHATMRSQMIHARVRTQATRISTVCVAEKPSAPTTQPCTR